MAKIVINLLPPEIITQELKKARFYRIQFIGIVIILIMVFLTSLAVALRILQNRNISVAKAQLSEKEERVSGLKDTQASLLLLKNRLAVINKYMGVPSKPSSLYRLIDQLIPVTISVSSVSIGKTGDITLSVLAADSANLDDLINNLIVKDNNKGQISQVSLESLSRGRDGLYRVSLSLK